MTKVLRPYIMQTIEAQNLPADQRAILYLDCYPVHLGLKFRTFVWSKFPNIFLIFVPANCTGIFQPADVGLQRVVKHKLQQAALDFLVRSHTTQLQDGLTAEQIRFTTSLPTLRDASVAAIVDAWKFMSSFGRCTMCARRDVRSPSHEMLCRHGRNQLSWSGTWAKSACMVGKRRLTI